MIKFKYWEHFVNALITITILGGVITFLVETDFAKKYKYWFKKVFYPVAFLLSKRLLSELGGKQAVENFAIPIVRREVDKLDIDEKTKDLLKTASDKVIIKVLNKVEKG